MKKQLLLIAFIGSLLPLSARTIQTHNNNIICDLHKLNEDEVEKLLFNEKAAKFFGQQLRSIDSTEFIYRNHTHGHHSLPIDNEKYFTLKNVHERLQPYLVTITNNSDRAITIIRNEYITTLSEALFSFKRLIKLYPDFKAHATGSMIASVVTGVIAGLCGIAAVAAALGPEGERTRTITTRKTDIFGRVYVKNKEVTTSRGATVAGSLVFGGLLGLSAYFFYEQAQKAKKLEKRKQKLGETSPYLYTVGEHKQKLSKRNSFTIAPGQTFTEHILVNHKAITSNSAIFGAVAPELSYTQYH